MEMRIAGPSDVVNGILTEAGVEAEAKPGHTTLEIPKEATPEQAQVVFKRLRSKGFRGYQKDAETGENEPINEPDMSSKEDVVLVPPMAGGCR